MRVVAKFLKILSGQCYGKNEKFPNFYPDLGMGSKGIFRGPTDVLDIISNRQVSSSGVTRNMTSNDGCTVALIAMEFEELITYDSESQAEELTL